MEKKQIREEAKRIDAVIGKNFRRIRSFAGIKQQEVAAKLGVTYQQIQKYETGIDRLSASKLFQASLIFGCSLDSFFEGVLDDRKTILDTKCTIQDLKIIEDLASIKQKDVKATLHNLITLLSKEAA